MVRGAPKSAAAEKLRGLATTVFGTGILGSTPGVAKPERRGLFGRR